MTTVLIKSKLLNLVASGKGGASQRGGPLPRDKKSLADEAKRGRGGGQYPRHRSRFVSAAPAYSFFASRYQTRGQEVCVDSLQSDLNLPRDGSVPCEAQSVSEFWETMFRSMAPPRSPSQGYAKEKHVSVPASSLISSNGHLKTSCVVYRTSRPHSCQVMGLNYFQSDLFMHSMDSPIPCSSLETF